MSVGTGWPHTFREVPFGIGNAIRRRGGCRKHLPVDLPRVAPPIFYADWPARAAALLGPTAERQRLRQHLHPHSWQVVGNIAATVMLWITPVRRNLPADPAAGRPLWA
jgi:hypothetical protein